MVRGHAPRAFALLIGALLMLTRRRRQREGGAGGVEVGGRGGRRFPARPWPDRDIRSSTSKQQQPPQQDQLGEWVEHFDKASGKPFFYNELLKQTAWEAPAGRPEYDSRPSVPRWRRGPAPLRLCRNTIYIPRYTQRTCRPVWGHGSEARPRSAPQRAQSGMKAPSSVWSPRTIAVEPTFHSSHHL